MAPASVFVHLCFLSEENGEYQSPAFNVIDAARPCAIFSYIVNIMRDFQEDQQNNLNYFALDILEKNQLLPSDLKKMANGSSVTGSFRGVIREYHELARQYSEKTLREIEKLSHILTGRYLFSLQLIYQLYKDVFDRIDVEHGRFTCEELIPTPREIRERVLEVASGWQQG